MAVALPLLGGWVASTLAIQHGASHQWAWAAGLGLGLGLPVLWEVLSQPRRRPGIRPRRWFRLRTRLLLRTWVVNLVFLGGALALSPRCVFTALSTRGDWMLPPEGSPQVETARRLLFKAASGVEWAYVLATDNPYRDQLIATAPSEPPRSEPPHPAPPKPAAKQEATPSTPKAPSERELLSESNADVVISWKTEPRPPEPEPKPSPTPEPEKGVGLPAPIGASKWRGTNPAEDPSKPLEVGHARVYPLPAQLHPRVASIPRSVETDLVSVANYLVQGERDPFQRVKAIHDYIADRVEYDMPAYRAKKFPSQSPEYVFQNRRAVCAGYSNLFAAMGKAAGEEIVTISGEGLTPFNENQVEGHAWNAVRIEGQWYLVDVTWDAGVARGDLFDRTYGTNYLFTPPDVFIKTHFPESPAWQLLEVPLDRGTAMRQAGVGCALRADPDPASGKRPWDGIRIVQPSRSREEVRGRFSVELDNPQGLRTSVVLLNLQERSQESCQSDSSGTRHTCTALGRGLYLIEVFADTETPSELVAQLEVLGT